MGSRILGALGRKLAKALEMDDPAPLTSVGPELVPVALLQDLTSPFEHEAGDVRLCVSAADQPAVVGEYSYHQLLNPANSGVVCHVEGLLVGAASAGKLTIVDYDTAFPTGAQSGFRDRRISGSPAATPLRGSNAVQVGTVRATFYVAATDAYIIPWVGVLGEGHGIAVHHETANEAITAAWFWAEREHKVS